MRDYQAELDELARTMHGPNGPRKLGEYLGAVVAHPKPINAQGEKPETVKKNMSKSEVTIYYKMNYGLDEFRPKIDFGSNAGIDLYAAEDTQFFGTDIAGLYEARVLTTFSLGLPRGVHGVVMGRSGNAVKRQTEPFYGVIDRDYTGVIVVLLRTYSKEVAEQGVPKGSAIAQLVLMNYAGLNLLDAQLVEVDRLEETVRGERGFGETTGAMV